MMVCLITDERRSKSRFRRVVSTEKQHVLQNINVGVVSDMPCLILSIAHFIAWLCFTIIGTG